MDRRRFLLTSLAGAFAGPRVAGAQQAGKVYKVGIVTLGSAPSQSALWLGFIDAMRHLGYVDGQNLVLRPALALGKPERLPKLVAALVEERVDVIATTSTQETLEAKRATATIPIVMTLVARPGRARTRNKPRAAGRQRNGSHESRARPEREIRRALARSAPDRLTIRRYRG